MSLIRLGDFVFIAQTLCVVVPIVLISLTLQSQRIEPIEASESGSQHLTATPMFETRDSHMLSVIAIVSNGIALILSILSNRFRWSERALKHDELLAMYSLIAQKARRLEDQWMEDRDARLFCNNLQDLFETAKNRGLEPSVRHFKKAKKLIRTLNVYPFGITSKTVNEVDDTLDAT